MWEQEIHAIASNVELHLNMAARRLERLCVWRAEHGPQPRSALDYQILNFTRAMVELEQQAILLKLDTTNHVRDEHVELLKKPYEGDFRG